eukprot:CFRG2597T1
MIALASLALTTVSRASIIQRNDQNIQKFDDARNVIATNDSLLSREKRMAAFTRMMCMRGYATADELWSMDCLKSIWVESGCRVSRTIPRKLMEAAQSIGPGDYDEMVDMFVAVALDARNANHVAQEWCFGEVVINKPGSHDYEWEEIAQAEDAAFELAQYKKGKEQEDTDIKKGDVNFIFDPTNPNSDAYKQLNSDKTPSTQTTDNNNKDDDVLAEDHEEKDIKHNEDVKESIPISLQNKEEETDKVNQAIDIQQSMETKTTVAVVVGCAASGALFLVLGMIFYVRKKIHGKKKSTKGGRGVQSTTTSTSHFMSGNEMWGERSDQNESTMSAFTITNDNVLFDMDDKSGDVTSI